MTLEEKIDKTNKCPHYFACLYDTDKCWSCGVDCEGGDDLLFLNGQGPDFCPYRLSFNRRKICCCPTHFWTWKNSAPLPPKDDQVGFWVVGENDVIIDTNQGMEDILGLPRDRILGARVRSAFPDPTIGDLLPVYDQAVRAGRTLGFQNVPVVTPGRRRSYHSGWVIPKASIQELAYTLCIIKGGSRNCLARGAGE